MCLYPRVMKNPKYKKNKKNKGNIPEVKDKRVLGVPVSCGKCMECLKRKARDWRIRLYEDFNEHTNGKFMTYSFDEESYYSLSKEFPELDGYDLDNAVATLAVRRYLERWRAKYKISLRHWFVTELGQNSTERIHIHGIAYSDNIEDLESIWKYGHVFTGSYCDKSTISYITKYVNKVDTLHKEYKPKVLTSAGIGSAFIRRKQFERHKFKKGKTLEYYRANDGSKLQMPEYYRRKLYNDEEKENLWIEKLDNEVMYVNGIKVKIDKGNDDLLKVLKQQRKLNKSLGYGDNEKDWKRHEYERQRRILQQNRNKDKFEN